MDHPTSRFVDLHPAAKVAVILILILAAGTVIIALGIGLLWHLTQAVWAG